MSPSAEVSGCRVSEPALSKVEKDTPSATLEYTATLTPPSVGVTPSG
jgi:hypothetical protein